MKRTRLIDLGVASYMPVWQRQEELHKGIIAAKLKGEDTENCMIFVEHNHVYTLGKSGNEANMLISAIQLQAAHAEFVKVNRGGDITYHGPGQLVVYPIIDMANFGVGVRGFVRRGGYSYRGRVRDYRGTVGRSHGGMVGCTHF